MLAIVTIRDPFGVYRNTGMNYRTLFGPHKLKATILKRAKEYAQGQPHRIEYFSSKEAVRSGRDADTVEYYNDPDK